MDNIIAKPRTQVKPRVVVFVNEILKSSEIPLQFKPFIERMINTYLQKMSEEELINILKSAKNEILPFLLGE